MLPLLLHVSRWHQAVLPQYGSPELSPEGFAGPEKCHLTNTSMGLPMEQLACSSLALAFTAASPPSLTFLLENASKEGTSSSLRGFYWSLQAHGCNGTAWWLPASTLRKIFKNVRNLYSAIWKKQEKHLTCVSGGSSGYLRMKTCIFNSQIDFAFLSDCTKLMIFFLLLKLWVRVSEKYYSLNSRVSSSLMTVSLL